ncbi:MAG TPA: DsrE family protein [Myxococcota bacterium]|nr:DsrE family protein [Myxococcota bacterium]
MTSRRTLTFALMDPPFESARSTTALRLVDLAIRRGHDVNVFAYEGAVSLSFARQKPHANAVHGRSVEEEDHPLTRDWIAALLEAARERGVRLDWANCGLCVDERGVEESVAGTRRGSPADLARFIEESDNTLVIPTGE